MVGKRPAIVKEHPGYKLGQKLASRGAKFSEFRKYHSPEIGWRYAVHFTLPKEPFHTDSWAVGEIQKHTTTKPELFDVQIKQSTSTAKTYGKYLRAETKHAEPREFLEHFAAGLKTRKKIKTP
ncbi:MAG TPA: hypothetical protein VGQ00_04545 [Candidatus Norongarragalinales archaeon]|nr:hypothetical protein [Candidatus Norongarragalinales archaeon]